MDDPRYPIGQFVYQGTQTPERRLDCIERIAAAPGKLRKAVAGLTDAQLDTPYREGGWTVRQVVHHVPDSHLNAYTRFRLALTEPTPTIRPYMEHRWAELSDAREAPVEISLSLLEALHRRWVLLLRSLGPADWELRFLHPEHGREWSLDEVLAMYAWHGEHHTAHVTRLRDRKGWH
jgi:DinB family protein